MVTGYPETEESPAYLTTEGLPVSQKTVGVHSTLCEGFSVNHKTVCNTALYPPGRCPPGGGVLPDFRWLLFRRACGDWLWQTRLSTWRGRLAAGGNSAVPTLPTAACCRGGPWAQGRGGQFRWPRACRAVPRGVCRSQRGETSSDPAWTLVDRRVLLDQGSQTLFRGPSREFESGRNLVVHVYSAVSYTHLTLPTKA